MKSQEFLAKHKVEAAELVDAGKAKLDKAHALKLARSAAHVIASKGKRVVIIDIAKDRPKDADLLAIMLGPTGNLRAPTLRVGRTLLVGFNEDVYRDVLKRRK